MWYQRLLLIGSFFAASECAAASAFSHPTEPSHYVSLIEAIEAGDLEQVRTILHEPANAFVLKTNRNKSLVMAVQQFLDSLRVAMATGNAWWYLKVGSAAVAATAILLLGKRYFAKKDTSPSGPGAAEAEDNTDADTPKPKKAPHSSSASAKGSWIPPQKPTFRSLIKGENRQAITYTHYEDDSQPGTPRFTPEPNAHPNPSPSSEYTAPTPQSEVSGDSNDPKKHERHVSFSQKSDSSDSPGHEKPRKKSEDSADTPSSKEHSSNEASPSPSDSDKPKPKKKGWFKTWRENQKVKKEQKKEQKRQQKENSSDSDNEKLRATANTGIFSSIASIFKSKKNKKRLEEEAETRLAIVRELLNEPECDPACPDTSGISALSLVQQKLDEFAHGTWEGRLLYDLYQLLQARVATN